MPFKAHLASGPQNSFQAVSSHSKNQFKQQALLKRTLIFDQAKRYQGGLDLIDERAKGARHLLVVDNAKLGNVTIKRAKRARCY